MFDWLLFLLFANSALSESNNLPNYNLVRVKRASNCSLDDFECKSGECITNLDLCDGIANCEDSWDESSESCSNYQCPPYTFKCAYGGCVFANARCDGKNDCLDNSDEADCYSPAPVTPETTTENKNYCFLPDHPANGFYYVNKDNEKKYKFGDKVPEGTQLTFGCTYQHEINPNIDITCIDRQWSDEVPKCEKICERLYRPYIRLQCYRDAKVIQCHPAFNGTNAKFTCSRHNTNASVIHYYTSCIEGNWDRPFKFCRDEDGGEVESPFYTCPKGHSTCASVYGCIKDAAICDGKFDCRDGSDETGRECHNFNCTANMFKCAYGGCVHEKAHCNGKRECYDNSDEDGCPPIDIPCVVPEAPENGFVSIQGRKGQEYTSGDEVPQGSMINFWCKLGYELSQQSNVSYCLSGKWLIDTPKCEKICDPIETKGQLKAKCYREESVVDCSKPFNQTRAKLKCTEYYEDPSLSLYPYRHCLNGLWDRNLPNCIPECGQKFVAAQKLIIGGQIAKKDHYPWTVGIYYKNDKQHICGGSLINQKVVLSAAHCFTDASDRKLPPEQFTITGGKHYRQFNHEEDKFAQYSDVEHIFIPNEYKGADQNFRADITVIILKEQFVLNHNVRPVCIDWGPTFETQQYNAQKTGIVLGWGLTVEGSNPSDELKELEVPHHSISKCAENLMTNFRRFATTGDKICGGYVNQSTSACQGDSGGGFVFLRGDRYYIRGIVSVAPKTPSGSCDSNSYTLFTQISKYNDFISKYESLYRPH